MVLILYRLSEEGETDVNAMFVVHMKKWIVSMILNLSTNSTVVQFFFEVQQFSKEIIIMCLSLAPRERWQPLFTPTILI